MGARATFYGWVGEIKQSCRMYIGLIPISVIDMCMQCSYRLGYEGGEKIMSHPISPKRKK